MILKGGYWEHTENGRFWRRSWRPRSGKASTFHRVELLSGLNATIGEADEWSVIRKDVPVWTIFITGRRTNEWGFNCKNGFRHWTDFVKRVDNKSEVGAGCD